MDFCPEIYSGVSDKFVQRREANFLETLEAVSAQRTAEANGAEPMITNWTPNSSEEAIKAVGGNATII